MQIDMFLNRRTGIGFGAAVCSMVLSLLLCALLLVRGVLPMSAATVWLWISYGLAALLGGRIAAAKQGGRLCAFFPAAFLYVLIWLLALGCKGEINFTAFGIGVTAAVIVGTLLAYMTAGSKRKKRSSYSKKRPAARTSRR